MHAPHSSFSQYQFCISSFLLFPLLFISPVTMLLYPELMAQYLQFQPALPFPPGVVVTGMAGRAERRQTRRGIPGVMIEMSRRQPHGVDDARAFGDHLCPVRNTAVFTAPARPFLTLPGQLVPIVRIEPAMFHPSTSLPSPHRLAQRSLLQPPPRF